MITVNALINEQTEIYEREVRIEFLFPKDIPFFNKQKCSRKNWYVTFLAVTILREKYGNARIYFSFTVLCFRVFFSFLLIRSRCCLLETYEESCGESRVEIRNFHCRVNVVVEMKAPLCLLMFMLDKIVE